MVFTTTRKMIKEYLDSKEKRIVQEKTFPLINKDKIVALAGPNVCEYLKKLPKVTTLEIWEKSAEVMLRQLIDLPKVKNVNIDYTFGDIYDAEVDPSAFYDLDFCCTVAKAEPHLRKFKECAFSITLSLRGNQMDKTIDKFLEFLGEKKVIDIPHPQFNHLTTDKNVYIYTTYCDTAPMITIFKFH